MAGRAQRQTFQQQEKELGPGGNHPPSTRAASRTSEAWPDQEIVPKNLLHPMFFPHCAGTEQPEDRNSSVPWSFGVFSESGDTPTPNKGWILSWFLLLLLSPSNPFLSNLALWLCPAGWCLSRNFAAAVGKPPEDFELSSIAADRRCWALRGSAWCHHHARVMGSSIP